MPRGWRRDPQWKMSENHPNPRMRRSVDTLVSKLRNMSFLAGHPEAVFEVVDQLMYHYLVSEEQHPGWLYSIHDKSGRYVLSALTTPPYQGGHNPTLADGLLGKALGEQAEVGDKASGESTAKPPSYAKVADGIEHVLVRHYSKARGSLGVIYCSCGKDFETVEKWSHHVQARITKYLEHELTKAPSEEASGEEAAQASSDAT
jgi:hypothetical protein